MVSLRRNTVECHLICIAVILLAGHVLCLAAAGIVTKEEIPDSVVVDGRSIVWAAYISGRDKRVGGYSATATLIMQNFCIWNLFNPLYAAHSGNVSYPPKLVEPDVREAMVMHNPKGSKESSFGTVSWELAGGRRAIIMWFVPYNTKSSSNRLAVGIIDRDNHTDSSADEMLRKNGSLFKRGTYANGVVSTPIVHCDEIFCVQGNYLINARHSTIKVDLYTKDPMLLAANAKDHYDKKYTNNAIG